MIEIKLINKIQETDDVVTFQFEKGNLVWRAGQYMAFVIPEVSQILEQYEHWFSISSAPHQETLDISVRLSPSQFKQALIKLNPGDYIQTHSIDGDFGWPENSLHHPIFIAGGIGITPFISMLRQQVHVCNEATATLHYFNRPNATIPFVDELEKLVQDHPGINIVYHTSKPLSLDPIMAAEDMPQNAIAYVAGPPPMIDRLGSELKLLGIPTNLDWYFGYDVTNY